MVNVRVSPDETAPNYDVSLADRKRKYGFLLDGGPGSIQEHPDSPISTRVTPGGTKFGDWEPGHSHIEKRTDIGGRGSDDFSADPARFFDSHNLFTLVDNRTFPTLQWKFATGLRTTHENLPGDLTWQPLLSSSLYVSHTFTVGGSNLSADNAEIWLRRKGGPGTLKIEIWTNSGGDPSSLVASATVSVTTSTITDWPSVFHTADLSAASDLSSGTVYHIVIYGATTDTAASHWEVGADTTGSTSKDSADGSTWATASFDIFFRVSDTDIDRKWHLFQLFGGMYAIDQRADGTASSLLLNGERGKATGGSSTTLVDTDDGMDGTWVNDQWNGWYIKIMTGTGKGQHRLISDTTSAGTITVTPAWDITPSTDSEYW